MRTRTILKALLALGLLFTVSGWAPAPPTNIVGSWNCEGAFLVTFNQGGTFVASPGDFSTSLNHSVWERTGLRTFETRDLAFIPGEEGVAVAIADTSAINTMSDSDTLSAQFWVTITELDGTVIEGPFEVPGATCTRIKVE